MAAWKAQNCFSLLAWANFRFLGAAVGENLARSAWASVTCRGRQSPLQAARDPSRARVLAGSFGPRGRGEGRNKKGFWVLVKGFYLRCHDTDL